MGSQQIICSVLVLYISLYGLAESRSQMVVSGKSTFFVISGAVEKYCKCVDFDDCDQADSCDVPDRPNACPPNQTCCKSPAPPGYNSTSTGTTTEESLSCECVLRTQCGIDPRAAIVQTSTKSLSCKNGLVYCCSLTENIEVLKPTVTEPVCGATQPSKGLRISNPSASNGTNFGQFPFMASVWDQNGTEFVCGASLISDNMLITAAQCLSGRHIETLRVRVADHDKTNHTSEETIPFREQTVSAVEIHPDFFSQENRIANDLAILVTADPFVCDDYVSPVCSVVYGFEKFAGPKAYNSRDCLATGWGKSSPSLTGEYSAVLKKVDLSLVEFDRCQEKLRTSPHLGSSFKLSPSFLCAGGVKGYDTCTGDGGGPLVCPMLSDPNRYVQVGVTSWGVGCSGEFPGVYASLEANCGWISSVHKQYSRPADLEPTRSNSPPTLPRSLSGV